MTSRRVTWTVGSSRKRWRPLRVLGTAERVVSRLLSMLIPRLSIYNLWVRPYRCLGPKLRRASFVWWRSNIRKPGWWSLCRSIWWSSRRWKRRSCRRRWWSSRHLIWLIPLPIIVMNRKSLSKVH